MNRIIALDWETYYDKTCSVKELGNWAYTHHPDFEAYMVSLYDGKDVWAGHPSQAPWDWVDGAVLLSHNAAFDVNVYVAEAERGRVPWLDIPAWHCTANLSVFLTGWRDLKHATETLFTPDQIQSFIGARGVSKAVRGSAEGKHYQDFLREPGQWEAMVDYAGNDAILCWQIWHHFNGHWSELEKLMSAMTIKGAMDGVAIDWDLVRVYQNLLDNALTETRAQLPWVADGAAPTSPLAIKDHCAQVGIPVPPVKSDDEEGYDRWVAENEAKYPWVRMISQYRKLNKMAAFLHKVCDRKRPDGTIESTILYFGAHTGRWAGALGEKNSSGINLQNLRKDPLKVGDKEVDQRAIFVPKNDKFIIADYAQIEARVINWLAGNEEMLELIRQGMSVYEAHARATMGWTGGVLKEEDPKLYALAKARVLMLGYGAGAKKFSDTAMKLMKMEISVKEAREIVNDFRNSNPRIRDFWNEQQLALADASRASHPLNVLRIPLRSGRYLTYNNVRYSRVKSRVIDWKADPEGNKMTEALIDQYTAVISGFKVKTLYGGLLTENIVQATARDIFIAGLSKCYEKGWNVPFHVHDEVVLDVPYDVTVDEAVSTLSYCPPWAEGCPVGVEAREADHYLKD